ncbi:MULTISPECIES: NO-inducible flavohemoprotein [Bacillus]|uniref:NO-inducible flavohemoprotein n=1 Tax=Bacillus TaxID=1386 RepID=UPI0003F6041F|nr:MULTISPECIES: NO-inducible flavohemoprotein [Bacillus]QHZ46033.1 NO-inducible flavohemoprotein [Bacillus sp. NSP9.1]
MLSEKTMQIVKSTAPVLKEKGTEITSCFYKRMFNAHPELKNIFNMSRQQTGGQPKALAYTVLQAAENIDRLEALLPVVKQIGHKHKSLDVKPEHYPIVGQHLLEAIEIVLGDAATEEILQAWAEAYEEIARVFIEIEKQMYDEDKKLPESWEGFKPFVVLDKRQESETITSFYLKPADGTDLPPFSPGQYVSVRIKIPGEAYFLTRQYSLSDVWNMDYYRISVKLEAEEGKPKGRVSSYLHEQMEIGGSLEVSVPAGDFTLSGQTDKPVYFISAGSGITPVMSMAKTLAAKADRNITFVHAAKSQEQHAFKEETEKLISVNPENRLLFVYSRAVETSGEHVIKGRVDEELLRTIVHDKDGEFYVCGPLSFMKNVIDGLRNLGVPMENIRYESFASSLEMEIAN